MDWEPPERDNGAAVSGYMLEFSLMRGRGRLLDAAPVWQAAYSGPDLHCQVRTLTLFLPCRILYCTYRRATPVMEKCIHINEEHAANT